MEFNNPWILLGMPLLLIPWLILELLREKQRVATLDYPAFPTRVLTSSIRSKLRRLPVFIRFLVLALMIVALAGPRVPSDETPIYKEGIDIIVAFDISTSMKALDFEPSDRFTVARNTIESFVSERKNDRLGLVVFAGEAFTQCPLTLDHAVLRNILSSIRMEVIEDGTAIGDALAVSINRLRDSEAKSKVIILLTDGVNNRGAIEPEKAAAMAAEFDVKIHTVQVGSGGRVPYPVQSMDPFTGRKIEHVQLAEIPVNPELMNSIAESTGGRFFKADDSRTLKRVFDIIDEMERTELPGEQFIMYDEIYGAFALPALLLLLLEVVLRLFWIRKFP